VPASAAVAPARPPAAPARAAYEAGDYAAAEAAARRDLTGAATAEGRAEARWVLAWSAARRGDLALARERFGLLRREAAGSGVQVFGDGCSSVIG
jgi:hypothetical protein